MPRLDDSMASHQIGGSTFGFSGTRVEHLGASSYTLASVILDVSSSVDAFADLLLKMLVTAVAACRKSPMSDNIMFRACTFSTQFHGSGGVNEIHGFKPLADIDASQYQPLRPYGGTPLNDAVYSGLAATRAYASILKADDFMSNGIMFVVTDGEENASTSTMRMIKDEQERIRRSEELESLISILIGVNLMGGSSHYLDAFAKDAGMTAFLDAGSATANALAKIGNFISQSVDSQSQAIGTGGPSQNIAAVI